jgi:hypothetical protein
MLTVIKEYVSEKDQIIIASFMGLEKETTQE